MARASIATPPDISGLFGAADAVRRNLYDSCHVVRTLGAMPPDPRTSIAIESERTRVAALCERYRQAVDRLIEAMTEGIN